MSLASESKFIIEKLIQKQFYLHYLTPSIPFRLFKNVNMHNELSKNKVCLPLNRFTDPLALSSSSSHISVWSESHLQFLKLPNGTRSISMEKLILKNPFKTQKLIKDSIDFGLKTMVVDNFQQLWKIHQCRSLNKTSSFQYAPINFVWMVSDPENDLKQIETLKNYNIKLGGLFFDETQAKKINDVKRFIEKVNGGLCQKKQLRTIYIESCSEQFEKTQAIYRNDEFLSKNKIEVILEKIDFKMTDKYWIAARVIGENRRKDFILNDEAYNYLSVDQVKRGQVIQQQGKKWILSSINYFPELKVMQEHERKGYIMNVN